MKCECGKEVEDIYSDGILKRYEIIYFKDINDYEFRLHDCSHEVLKEKLRKEDIINNNFNKEIKVKSKKENKKQPKRRTIKR